LLEQRKKRAVLPPEEQREYEALENDIAAHEARRADLTTDEAEARSAVERRTRELGREMCALPVRGESFTSAVGRWGCSRQPSSSLSNVLIVSSVNWRPVPPHCWSFARCWST